MGWPWEEGGQWSASYNIAPGTSAPVVPNLERPVVALHCWGLIPSWAKDRAIGNRMINARAETLAEKPGFREAFRKRRCLVLADGFYEWKRQDRQKIPLFVRPRSRRPFCFAGLWDRWNAPGGEWLKTFTIITTEPNELLAPIHDRMPVILAPEAFTRWLSPEPKDPGSLADLLVPISGDGLEAYEVSTLVNNPVNNTADCIRPVSGFRR
jgi:putative SOS response-associated peptidase YedK